MAPHILVHVMTMKLHDTQQKWKKMAKDAREKAEKLPPGPEREALMKEARQLDTAVHMDEWASSPGLRSPKS